MSSLETVVSTTPSDPFLTLEALERKKIVYVTFLEATYKYEDYFPYFWKAKRVPYHIPRPNKKWVAFYTKDAVYIEDGVSFQPITVDEQKRISINGVLMQASTNISELSKEEYGTLCLRLSQFKTYLRHTELAVKHSSAIFGVQLKIMVAFRKCPSLTFFEYKSDNAEILAEYFSPEFDTSSVDDVLRMEFKPCSKRLKACPNPKTNDAIGKVEEMFTRSDIDVVDICYRTTHCGRVYSIDSKHILVFLPTFYGKSPHLMSANPTNQFSAFAIGVEPSQFNAAWVDTIRHEWELACEFRTKFLDATKDAEATLTAVLKN